jgi:hypothetical protein
MKTARLLPLALLLFILPASACPTADAPAEAPQVKKKPLTVAEQKFSQLLSGAELEGRYTTWDQLDTLKKDTYTVSKVSKIGGDMWLFKVRIRYADHDATVPLPLHVKWAGDTPVITLDKFPVPGFGTFSARVLFHGRYYAGTWDAGDHGGHMYGTVVLRADGGAAPAQAASKKSGEK